MSAARPLRALAAFGLTTLTTLALAGLAPGCGGGQTRGQAFDRRWTNDDGAGLEAFRAAFASTKVPLGADVAVGLGGSAVVVGVPLASGGGPAWTFEHPLDARPAVAGSAVVGLGGGELFALDALTGKLLWKRPAGGFLRGVGDDGKTTVVSMVSPTGRGSVVLAVNRNGEVVRQIEDPEEIGVPSVVDHYAFLPWAAQNVSIYDLQSGEERARALLRTETTRVFALGGTLVFGGAAATRFDERIRFGAESKASTTALPDRELPGNPRWMARGTDTLALAASALDKLRLYARPVTTGEPAIEGGRFAATFFRIVVGFDAKTGAPVWAHAHDADLLGGAAYAGGFALCDAAGKVTFLDGATGAVVSELSFGRSVGACTVQADALGKPGGTATPAKPASLAEQLASVVRLPDAELVPMQKLLLREMQKLEDPRVTSALIELCGDEHTPPAILADARAALAARRTGATEMLAALAEHYDFLAGTTRTPPVAPLADALAAAGEKRAAPLLAAHLNDPADSPDEVAHAAKALAVLAGKDELPALQAFFALYRGVQGTDADEALQNAVVSVAQALVRAGRPDVVASARTDPFTLPALKLRLARLPPAKAPPAP